jgi:AAA family ATP:ADP antiporter
MVEVGKIAENSLDYSIYNQAKQALWLPTSREQKYVAKQAIDTFVVRAGDLLSGAFVGLGAVLALSTTKFTMLNVVLGILFLGIVVIMGREHKKRAAEVEAQKEAEGRNVPAGAAKTATAKAS